MSTTVNHLLMVNFSNNIIITMCVHTVIVINRRINRTEKISFYILLVQPLDVIVHASKTFPAAHVAACSSSTALFGVDVT